MKPSFRPGLLLFIALFGAALLVLPSCSTIQYNQARQSTARHPAADEALIEKFVDALSSRSSLGSEQAVEDAVTQVVNDNATKLNLSQINSLNDIASMSDVDQSRIIGELANLPELSERLSLDSDAVNVARGEALAAQDVQGVTTEAVPNLQAATAADTDSLPGFSKILTNEPELKDDVSLMIKENADIRTKTGVSVLAKGCDSLQNPDSVENLATVMSGVDRDVESGQAADTPSVSKSLQNNMEYVLGTDAQDTHQRICVLSDSNQCGVFSPKMCN